MSIIIPRYNVNNIILELLQSVKTSPVSEREIIIVDVGSKDGTRDTVRQLNDDEVKIIFQEHNQSKGAALRTGFTAATGDTALSRMQTWNTTHRNFRL